MGSQLGACMVIVGGRGLTLHVLDRSASLWAGLSIPLSREIESEAAGAMVLHVTGSTPHLRTECGSRVFRKILSPASFMGVQIVKNWLTLSSAPCTRLRIRKWQVRIARADAAW